MGFMDKAKQMADQAQQKIEDAQKQFNESQSQQSQQPGGGVRYDSNGRPIEDAVRLQVVDDAQCVRPGGRERAAAGTRSELGRPARAPQ